MQGPVRVGVLGCGNVSSRYLGNIAGRPEITVLACADPDHGRAEALAREHGVPSILSVEALLADPRVDLVLNLTPPRAHATVTLAALEHGKHVYTEKPLATTLADARRILTAARSRSLLVGTAPDTFMGVGPATCLRLIHEGAIGSPVSVSAAMMNAGPERFHPEPEFLYRTGAGPLLDIGPYYVTVLTELLGPIIGVTALGGAARSERNVLAGPRAGTAFPVEVLTHVTSVLKFASGAVGTLTTSFDVTATTIPPLEIHGTIGTIIATHANSWGGPILLSTVASPTFSEVLPPARPSDGFMGMGLLEMARSILAGTDPAASASRGFHVLEVLTAIGSSAELGGRFIPINSTLRDGGA